MSDNEAPDAKPEKVEAGEQISLKVKDNKDHEIFFKVKKTTKLGKIRKAFAQKMGRAEDSVRLVYDGERVDDKDTPESVSA